MYKNILVINLMHIGDLMLVTPVLRTLRANYPEAKITLLADKKLRDLVEYNEHIDECLLIDKKGVDDKLPAFIKFIFKVRAKNYDLVVNLHRNERASALAAFSGAKKIVGYSKPGFALFFTQTMPNLNPVKHQIHSHFDVLRDMVGVTKIDDGGLEMVLPPGADDEAAKMWAEKIPAGAKVIGFNIGASWATKRWIDTYFAECADRFLAEGYHIAFFGGPMDVEMVEKCRAQQKVHDGAREHIFTGRVSLGVLAGLLRRLSLFITTDSGPMHVAVAMNTPIVTMFGASPVPGFYPYDGKDILIKTPEPCHPCGIHDCPNEGERNMACMKNIPVDVVMQYSHELLEEMHGAPGMDCPPHYGDYECRVIEL